MRQIETLNDLAPDQPPDADFEVPPVDLGWLDADKPMNRGGRKTKLTPEVHDKIIKLLRMGNYIKTVCAHVGISGPTFYDWIERGVKEMDRIAKGKRPKASEAVFVKFASEVPSAEAEAEVRNVAIIQKAASDRQVERTVTTTEVVTDSVGNVVNGADGKPLKKIITRKESFTEFEAKMAVEFLQRRFRDRWGRQAIDVTHGGKIEHTHQVIRIGEQEIAF